MKPISIFFFFCSVWLTGCYNNKLTVSSTRLHSHKELTSTIIRLLVVDSLGADGFPARFRTERIYEAFFSGSNFANKLHTLYFQKNTWRYVWKTAEGEARYGTTTIPGFTLQPNRWYCFRKSCHFGFLTDGYCVLFFKVDEKGNLVQKRADEKNEGPF